ncbi:MAG: NUDIX domain-containing protein [Bacteroidota bacterium]
MKIFLNDRVVEFVAQAPANPLPADMIIEYENAGKLEEAWLDFERYDQYRKLFVVDRSAEPGNPETVLHPFPSANPGALPSFREFTAFFKYVPAAGGLVKNEKGEYLFIHRLGFWDLPKGKIDKKDLRNSGMTVYDLEAARIAAVREVTEETGIKTVSITGELPSTWHIYTAKEKRILKQTIWFQMSGNSSETLKPQTSEGIFLVKWTPTNAIHCILTHTYTSIRELLLEVIF